MPAVRLNELLSNPESINWDGRGRVDLSDQWLELYNTTRRAVDLRNWSIEIVDRTATQTYRFARRQVLAAGDHLVLFGREVCDARKPKCRPMDDSPCPLFELCPRKGLP